MKRLLLLLGIIVSLNAYAQQHPKLALINEAELAIVDGNLEKAAEIYNQLFLQKDEIWAQDLYNAAVVEMKLGTLDYAKKYLNELAKRGVPIEEIEEKGIFQEAYEWDNYKVTYQQFAEFNNGETIYDRFVSKSNNTIDSLSRSQIRFRKMLPKLSFVNDKFFIKILDQPEIVLDTTLGWKYLFNLNNEITDSVSLLPKWANEVKSMNAFKDDLIDQLIAFLIENEFPIESQIKNTSLLSENFTFYNILQEILEYAEFEYNSKGGSTFYMPDNPLILHPDKTNKKQKLIIDFLIKAVKAGRLKSEVAFYILFPNNYYKLIPIRFAFIHIEYHLGCDISNNQIYFLNVMNNDATIHGLWNEKLSLTSLDQLKKKLVFQMSNNSPFIFNIPTTIEQAQFPNCESAKIFIKDAVKLK